MTRWSSGLRHCPFTAVTWVRIPYGSFIFGGLAQLGEHLPYKQEVTGSSPVSSIPNILDWFVGLVGLGRLPVTQEVTSSSLVRTVVVIDNIIEYLSIARHKWYGSVAQLVEQRIEAPCVGSSILSRAI